VPVPRETTWSLLKPPRSQCLPDVVTVEERERIFLPTPLLSCSAFFFTLYSRGLRLCEGLRSTLAPGVVTGL
jgi:integrase/recombinase XerD